MKTLELWTISLVLVFTLYLAETESTRCSEWSFCCNELAWIGKPKLLRFFAEARLVVAAASLLFRCSKSICCHNERSLPCHNLMCNIIVEMLCRYGMVCLLSIDNIDNLIIDVDVVHLNTLNINDIANRSLSCNMLPRYWVIYSTLLGWMTDDVSTVAERKTRCHDIGLLRPTCLVRCVHMHHVVRLNDRWGQHCFKAKDLMPWYWATEADVLGRMCLYASLWKYELLRNRPAMCELLSSETILDLCYELILKYG